MKQKKMASRSGELLAIVFSVSRMGFVAPDPPWSLQCMDG
jgi:hypothetical protein